MPGASTLAERIVREQELIIGPLAWREAEKVNGLKIGSGHKISVTGSGRDVLASLVKRYEGLFGPASREVCREAVKSLLPDMPEAEVPDVLR